MEIRLTHKSLLNSIDSKKQPEIIPAKWVYLGKTRNCNKEEALSERGKEVGKSYYSFSLGFASNTGLESSPFWPSYLT